MMTSYFEIVEEVFFKHGRVKGLVFEMIDITPQEPLHI